MNGSLVSELAGPLVDEDPRRRRDGDPRRRGGPPDHISPTSARNYLSCPLRFYFERVLGLRKPTSPALHLGKSVHAALQRFHLAVWRGGDQSPEAVEQAFDEAFTALEKDEGPVSWTDTKTREKAREDGLRVVAAYLDSPEALREPPKAVEVHLHEEIEGLSVPLTGVVDLVRRNLVPVDFNSASARPDPQQAAFDHELQLVAYQLLLESVTGATPPALELVFLVKTKVPQVVTVEVPPAGELRKLRTVRMLETAVEGIAAGRYHPQPGMHCSWCQFRAECSKWVPGAFGERGAA
jgi:putative RecB family exonuclease